ncbi:MAG: ATP-binding protein [Gemmatimonadaceae bacterium]
MKGAAAWLLWWLIFAVVTALALSFRVILGPAVNLVFLAVIFGAAVTRGGRALATWLAVGSVVVLSYSFQQPYGTWTVTGMRDVLQLIVFLTVGLSVVQLAARSRERLRLAELNAQAAVALSAERERSAAAEEQARLLRETDRLKGALLAAVSHELRTPLSTIKASAAMEAELGNPTAARIERQADLMIGLIRDLLKWSRLASGRLALDPDYQAIDDLLQLAAGHAAEFSPGRAVSMDTSVPVASPVWADRALTLRILTILVDNAHVHTPAESPLELGASVEGEMILLTVADRGPGVPLEDEERIFAPFVRGATHADGTGLGLAMARVFAEAQGGNLRMRARPGGGAQFELRLPRRAPANGSA